MNSSTVISWADVVYIPERILLNFFYGIQIIVYSVYGQPGKMIRFRIWIITVLTVLDEVSSSLSCVGTEVSERSHICKSCYLFIPLLQSLVKILDNLLWWLTWDLVLLYTGLGNETGLKNPHPLWVVHFHPSWVVHFHPSAVSARGFVCYKPAHEPTWVKNSPFLGFFAFHHSYCSDAVTAVTSKQLYQHILYCWPETQDCPYLRYWQRWCSVKLQPWH